MTTNFLIAQLMKSTLIELGFGIPTFLARGSFMDMLKDDAMLLETQYSLWPLLQGFLKFNVNIVAWAGG
jgi:hypothetical protein